MHDKSVRTCAMAIGRRSCLDAGKQSGESRSEGDRSFGGVSAQTVPKTQDKEETTRILAATWVSELTLGPEAKRQHVLQKRGRRSVTCQTRHGLVRKVAPFPCKEGHSERYRAGPPRTGHPSGLLALARETLCAFCRSPHGEGRRLVFGAMGFDHPERLRASLSPAGIRHL